MIVTCFLIAGILIAIAWLSNLLLAHFHLAFRHRVYLGWTFLLVATFIIGLIAAIVYVNKNDCILKGFSTLVFIVLIACFLYGGLAVYMVSPTENVVEKNGVKLIERSLEGYWTNYYEYINGVVRSDVRIHN